MCTLVRKSGKTLQTIPLYLCLGFPYINQLLQGGAIIFLYLLARKPCECL